MWKSSEEHPAYHQESIDWFLSADWYTYVLCRAYEKYYRYDRIRRSLLDYDNEKEEKQYSEALKLSDKYIKLVEYIRYRISLKERKYINEWNDLYESLNIE